MKAWSKIFPILLLISLLLHLSAGSFKISMPSATERGIRQSLLLTEAATEETIDIQMEEAEEYYKTQLTTAGKFKIYTRSTVWWLLLISAIGLLCSKPWGYYLLYGSTVLNLYTSLCYLPLLVDLVLPWLHITAGLILIQLINFSMVAPLIVVHRKINKNPNKNTHSITGSAGSE